MKTDPEPTPVLLVRESADLYPIYRYHRLTLKEEDRRRLFYHAPWMAGWYFACRCTICWMWKRLARREQNALRAKYGHPPVRDSWGI